MSTYFVRLYWGFSILSVVEVSFVRGRRCHTERWLVGSESSCAFISFFLIFQLL